MKCIILAAGYATRLYPLTENFPKPLLDVDGKPILDWLIEDIRESVDEFIVISNHKFASHFESWAKEKDYKITVLDDGTTTNESRLGAVKDIEFAVKELAINDDCIVMAGDNLLDFSLKDFADFAISKGTSCVMYHREDRLPALQKTAVITLDEDNAINSYEEKPVEPKGTLAVPPFYYYRAQDILRVSEALESGCSFDAPGSFAAWLSTKTAMHAFVMPGKRYDIGDVESYERVKEVFGR